MKNTIFILILTILPSFGFAQGIHKINIGFMGGLNVPFEPKEFTDSKKTFLNAGVNAEYTASSAMCIGMELNSAFFKQGIPQAYVGDKEGNKLINLLAVLKIQDNTIKKNTQGYFKVAAGQSFSNFEENINAVVGDHNYIPVNRTGFACHIGAGLNYLLGNGNKFFGEATYRMSEASDKFYALFFNVGYSFCVNPK